MGFRVRDDARTKRVNLGGDGVREREGGKIYLSIDRSRNGSQETQNKNAAFVMQVVRRTTNIVITILIFASSFVLCIIPNPRDIRCDMQHHHQDTQYEERSSTNVGKPNTQLLTCLRVYRKFKSTNH